MALIEDALKGNAVTGLAAGIGTVVLAPLVVPAIAWVVRPMATVACRPAWRSIAVPWRR